MVIDDGSIITKTVSATILDSYVLSANYLITNTNRNTLVSVLLSYITARVGCVIFASTGQGDELTPLTTWVECQPWPPPRTSATVFLLGVNSLVKQIELKPWSDQLRHGGDTPATCAGSDHK